jgi:hypothetical protein
MGQYAILCLNFSQANVFVKRRPFRDATRKITFTPVTGVRLAARMNHPRRLR